MLNFMAKPTSFQCNIRCKYCFYLEKKDVVSGAASAPGKMSQAVLEAFIEKKITGTQEPEVYFTWQGGEPTLAGLAFYRQAVALQQYWAQKQGKTVHNAIQTNGILLNEQWGKFLKQHNFLVGISIDGDEELHNAYRLSNVNRGTWHKVIQGIAILKKHQIPFNTLTVVNNLNVQHPLRVYQFLKQIGSRHMQFLPLLEAHAPHPNLPAWMNNGLIVPPIQAFSVPSRAYGEFMNRIFDCWIKQDIGTVAVQLFESLLGRYCGFEASMCIYQPECGGENLALEANGDIYQCDHLVYPEMKIGNILTQQLDEIAANSQSLSTRKQQLNSQCQQCEFLALCHGGCPKHRLNLNAQLERHNYFCEGYKLIFKHTLPAMNFMATLKSQGLPADLVRHYLAEIGLGDAPVVTG